MNSCYFHYQIIGFRNSVLFDFSGRKDKDDLRTSGLKVLNSFRGNLLSSQYNCHLLRNEKKITSFISRFLFRSIVQAEKDITEHHNEKFF